MIRFAAALWLLAFIEVAGAEPAELRLGATHTLEDSGILARLVAAFGAERGTRVRTLVAGTGQVMRYAGNGDVDVVLTHSRPDEEDLVRRGIGAARLDVMWNDFVIAGPAADPARVRGLRDAAQALARIRASRARFVSRGDDSGTHKKELQLWRAAGGLARWSGYLSAGQGAGKTLLMADELQAYDLVDRATWRQIGKRAALPILVEGDARLVNEYAVTTLRPAAARRVNAAEGEAFAQWLRGESARRLIAAYRIDGARVFYLPGESPPASP